MRGAESAPPVFFVFIFFYFSIFRNFSNTQKPKLFYFFLLKPKFEINLNPEIVFPAGAVPPSSLELPNNYDIIEFRY